MAEFEIFRSKHNATHYVAVAVGDASHNAEGVRTSENLLPHCHIPDDGTRHLGFDPVAAKVAIGDHGFFAFALTVEERDNID